MVFAEREASVYMVEGEEANLRLYTDYIARYDDEPVPEGVFRREGDEYHRKVMKRFETAAVNDRLARGKARVNLFGGAAPDGQAKDSGRVRVAVGSAPIEAVIT